MNYYISSMIKQKKSSCSFITYLPINYIDASGRKYVQKFDIIFNKSRYASKRNFEQPELYKKVRKKNLY